MLVLVTIAGCSDDCGNTVVSSKTARDARRSAVLFQRNCGATAGFSTQISVLEAGHRLASGGNVFIADAGHGGAEAAPWGGPWAEVVWLSPRELLVRYDAKARVFRRSDAVLAVKVRFEPVSRP